MLDDEARTVRVLSEGADDLVGVEVVEELREALFEGKEALSLVELIGVENLVIVVLD